MGAWATLSPVALSWAADQVLLSRTEEGSQMESGAPEPEEAAQELGESGDPPGKRHAGLRATGLRRASCSCLPGHTPLPNEPWTVSRPTYIPQDPRPDEASPLCPSLQDTGQSPGFIPREPDPQLRSSPP